MPNASDVGSEMSSFQRPLLPLNEVPYCSCETHFALLKNQCSPLSCACLHVATERLLSACGSPLPNPSSLVLGILLLPWEGTMAASILHVQQERVETTPLVGPCLLPSPHSYKFPTIPSPLYG